MDQRLTKENGRNAALDVLKLVAAYAVVFIHFKFSGTAGDLVEALSRFAVPVFFMISGYFAYGNSTEKLKRKIKNIFMFYVSGAVLYFCFNAFLTMWDEGIKSAAWYALSYVNPVILLKYIVFNVPRSSDHLWYLPSLLYAYGILFLLTKYRAKEKLFLLSGAALLIVHLALGVGLSSMGIVIPEYMVRNFLLMAYPLLCLGMLIRKYEDVLHRIITCKVAILLLAAGAIETVISYYICGLNELYIGSLWIAVSLFMLALKMKNRPINARFVKFSQISTAIYLIHIFVGYTLERFIVTDSLLMQNLFSILVCIVTTVVAQQVRYVNRYIKNRR